MFRFRPPSADGGRFIIQGRPIRKIRFGYFPPSAFPPKGDKWMIFRRNYQFITAAPKTGSLLNIEDDVGLTADD